jgi:hypothetical protein
MSLNDLEYHACMRPIRTLLRQECFIVGGYIGCLAELDHWRMNIALAPVSIYFLADIDLQYCISKPIFFTPFVGSQMQILNN